MRRAPSLNAVLERAERDRKGKGGSGKGNRSVVWKGRGTGNRSAAWKVNGQESNLLHCQIVKPIADPGDGYMEVTSWHLEALRGILRGSPTASHRHGGHG